MQSANEQKKLEFLDKKGVSKEEETEAFWRAGLPGEPKKERGVTGDSLIGSIAYATYSANEKNYAERRAVDFSTRFLDLEARS